LLGLMVAPDEATRLSAVWVLGEIDLPDARALLLAREPIEPSPRVRAKIHELLAGALGREVRT
jgi:HEAT repeat protein